MNYSRNHYRALADYGGGNDSKEAVSARRRKAEIGEQVRRERRERFPDDTTASWEEISAWQEARLLELNF